MEGANERAYDCVSKGQKTQTITV